MTTLYQKITDYHYNHVVINSEILKYQRELKMDEEYRNSVEDQLHSISVGTHISDMTPHQMDAVFFKFTDWANSKYCGDMDYAMEFGNKFNPSELISTDLFSSPIVLFRSMRSLSCYRNPRGISMYGFSECDEWLPWLHDCLDLVVIPYVVSWGDNQDVALVKDRFGKASSDRKLIEPIEQVLHVAQAIYGFYSSHTHFQYLSNSSNLNPSDYDQFEKYLRFYVRTYCQKVPVQDEYFYDGYVPAKFNFDEIFEG